MDGETTIELIRRAQSGDELALDAVCRRLMPAARRIARGRLPAAVRRLIDTDDLVQDVLRRTCSNLPRLKLEDRAQLIAYIATGVRNRIAEERRKLIHRPEAKSLGDSFRGDLPSPLEEAIGGELLRQYHEALERLPEQQRALVVARVEYRMAFKEIGELFERSEDAARMMVSRALVRVAKEIRHE